MSDPLSLARTLVRNGVQLVVIGGHAVNYHGFPRATQDIDIIINRKRSRTAALYETLSAVNAYWISNEVDPQTGLEQTVPVSEDYVSSEHMMMLGTDQGYIDIFDFVPGLPNTEVDAVFADCEMIDEIPVVGLNWLKAMKRASGRPQDLIDLENLP